MKTLILAAASAVAVTVAAASASAASYVEFPSTGRNLVFADGVFSHDLSGGVRPDGFYGKSLYSAINGWGQNGEYVQFNTPVQLYSLVIGKCVTCFDSHPALFTVNLYDAGSALLDSRSVAGSSTAETLVFDRAGVTKVEFTFSDTNGQNPFNDGREVAWFQVADITYDLGAVPEPAVWGLMIAGFGLAGAAIRRRRALAG